jgi:TonB family protein
MKTVWLRFVIGVILMQSLAWTQQSSDSAPNTLAYENGTIANNSYTNECFGFSLTIPDGWQLNTQVVGPDAKGRHTPGGGLVLLVIERHKDGAFGDRIVLTASDASGLPPTVQEFVSGSVQQQIKSDPEHRELLRDAHIVDYAGKHFARADYKQRLGERPLYLSFVYTKFRGHYIGETLMSGSPEGLEESANSLQYSSFREDQPNSKCVMKGDSNSTGMIGGVIGSVAQSSQSGQPQQRVRVSQGVSQGLLIKKVQPRYPEEARQGRLQGQVVLQVVIDKNGDFETVSLVSGHPLLAPAAIEAVKQWKYKPYLLQGQPVAVDTQVIVNFQLSWN